MGYKLNPKLLVFFQFYMIPSISHMYNVHNVPPCTVDPNYYIKGKMSLFWLKTPLKKHLVTFDNNRADMESKQGLKTTGLYIIQTKEMLYFLTSFPLIWSPLLQKVRRVKWKSVCRGILKSTMYVILAQVSRRRTHRIII